MIFFEDLTTINNFFHSEVFKKYQSKTAILSQKNN